MNKIIDKNCSFRKKMAEKKIFFMKKIGKIVSDILKKIWEEIKIGSCGTKINSFAKKLMDENGVFSSCFDYKGFPAYICISINYELTHGIPNENKFLFGDMISVDVSCFLYDDQNNKYHADSAFTKLLITDINQKEINFDLKKIINRKKKLIEITKSSLDYVVNNIVPGVTTTRDIGKMIENYVKNEGNYFPIKEYGGHGIGSFLHQDPFIPNYEIPWNGTLISPGMFICVEPLVQENDDLISISSDKWTIFSKNKFFNAHFEYTLYIGDRKAEIISSYE